MDKDLETIVSTAGGAGEAETLFALVQRKATALANSELVPTAYQGNVPNCMIALELAERTKSSPFMVMQNVHIIKGRPSWSSTFIIAAINASKRFTPLRFTLTGEGATRECFAWAKGVDDGELIEGPVVSMEMAKAEGWLQKAGSKWKTMPELMLRYRAAAFYGRLFAPEILMGMSSVEEISDITAIERPSVTDALEGLRDVTPEPPELCGKSVIDGEPCNFLKGHTWPCDELPPEPPGDPAMTEPDSPALMDEPPDDHHPTAFELEGDGDE